MGRIGWGLRLPRRAIRVKPKRKRTVILVLVGLIVLLALIGCWRLTQDDAPFDDSHLRIVYEAVPDEENALTYFLRATEKLVLPEDRDERLAYGQLLKDYEGAWKPELAATVVEANEGLWEDIERGLACAHCQFPECRFYDYKLPGCEGLRDVARVGALRARLLSDAGWPQEALDQAMSIVRFGCRLEEGRGPLIGYLVGASVKHIGLKEVRYVLAGSTMPAEQLLPYIEQLKGCGGSVEGLANALRIEYTMAANTVDDMIAGRFASKPISPADRVKMRRFTLKPNRTKRLFAADHEMLIASADRPYARATLPEIRRPKSETWWMVKAFTSGNGVGKIMYRLLMPAIPGVLRHKCVENCNAAATRILIALKCYKLEHGELPETLDALVPEYLEAVPLDDFDGKPMKYARDKRVVYAVGTDLTDNGGIAEDGREDILPRDGYDLIYKIEF
jgi:hypothetical protein